MGLEPDARLVANRELDLRQLPLTPIDFFLYSRVEMLGNAAAAPTIADVIAASGQPSESAEQALAKLIELGALVIAPREPERRVASPTAVHVGVDRRKQARERKLGLLAAQLRLAKSDPAAPETKPSAGPESAPGSAPSPIEESSLPTPRQGQQPAQGQRAAEVESAEPGSILDQVEPVPGTDSRLEPQLLAVPLDRQRRLLALRDRLRHLGHFELLGLEPVDDVKAIRRAYHGASREFHPDSYFGKDLGAYRIVLDDLFRRARSSYEFLLDGNHRKALVDSHEAQVREDRERHERAESATRMAAADEARRRAEAEAHQEYEKAQEARRVREQRDRGRLRDRATSERRKQALKYAEQARREQEIGRHGTAATLFRLAYEHEQDNAEYEREWRESLATARHNRAEASFQRGRESLVAGRLHEAARFLAEAADAEPTLRNLTQAAAVVSEVDPGQARSFAMLALETLQQAQAHDQPVEVKTVAGVHEACARAFLAAGQHASAREQAERANLLAPTKQTRALLNSTKLT